MKLIDPKTFDELQSKLQAEARDALQPIQAAQALALIGIFQQQVLKNESLARVEALQKRGEDIAERNSAMLAEMSKPAVETKDVTNILVHSPVKHEGKVMVFDVESVGLHGNAFAWGAVVVDLVSGGIVDEKIVVCDPTYIGGNPGIHEWVHEWIRNNVMTTVTVNCVSLDVMYAEFAEFYKLAGAPPLFADCAWPVEARFLMECRKAGFPIDPYPLLDIAPILWARGIDPTRCFDRLPSELPAHNPLNDARQSARILLEVLK